MRAIRFPLATAQAAFAGLTAYLLALLGAAAIGRLTPRQAPPDTESRLELAVLVPAHDEEAGLLATLDALRPVDYPVDQWEAIVIADNCTDGTARVAAAAGATVWERTDPERRGKGHALAWALARLESERPDAEAVVVLDADCLPSPNLLRAIASRLRDGAAAVQADYVVANPDDSWAAALRYAGFRLINTVRPLGKERLGLSAGLLGTGMGFRRDVLRRHPWDAFSVAEDQEFHARLVLAGERVAFAPEAAVTSAMPASLRAARAQQERWEGGKGRVARTWAPKLAREGVRRRDPVRLHAALELLTPSQSLLLAGNLALALVAAAVRAPGWRGLGAVGLGGQMAFVVGGLLLVRAPRSVYRALAMAPLMVVWKLGLLARLGLRGGPREWVRTERAPADVAVRASSPAPSGGAGVATAPGALPVSAG